MLNVHTVSKELKTIKVRILEQIVCNLLSVKENKLVMKNAKKLKNTNIFIDEDFCPATMEYRKQLRKKYKNSEEKVIVPDRKNKYALFGPILSKLKENYLFTNFITC